MPAFIKYQKNERHGLSLSRKAWENIVSIFNEKTRKQYEKKQLNNRLDVLRKDFITWEQLINETGVGRDLRTNKVFASNKWWQVKIDHTN